MTTGYKVKLGRSVQIPGFSEDEAREFVDALVVEITESVLDGFIQAPAIAQMRAALDSSGNFSKLVQLANSQEVIILHGVGTDVLGIFRGPPSANNPGPGWALDIERTMRFYGQSGDQSTWSTFFASRVGVLNTISS